MPEQISVSGAAAGTAGSAYRKILYVSKAPGTYLVNDANFPGLGAYLPSLALVSTTPGGGTCDVQISRDNGTNWHNLYGGNGGLQPGGLVYLDTANTFRIVVTNTSDIRFFIR